MSADRNVRATVGVGLLAVGTGVAVAIWQAERSSGPSLWTNIFFVGAVLVALVGLAILASLWSPVHAGAQRLKVRLRPQHAATPDPITLPPPTVEKLREAALQDYWGNDRYQASAEWNPTEQQAYLRLHRRDAGVSQSITVKVIDPTPYTFQKRPFTTYDEIVTARFPRDFQDKDFKSIAAPIIKGDYSVTWYALVENLSEVEIDGGTFRVPHDPPQGTGVPETMNDRVTRRETVYDEKGRPAGEEIVHESGRRDATVTPETVVGVTGPTGASFPVKRFGTPGLEFAENGVGYPIPIYGDQGIVSELFVVRARVKNDPPGRSQDAEITDAVVDLGFFPVGENTAEKECDGRWSDNPYPKLGDSSDDVLRRRLPATGEWQGIDVAIKHKGDSYFYAGSNWLAVREFGWRHEQYKLSGKSYRVSVTIRGHRVPDVTRWFRLENPPEGHTLGLTGEPL